MMISLLNVYSFYKSTEAAILANLKNSHAKSRNCILWEFPKVNV